MKFLLSASSLEDKDRKPVLLVAAYLVALNDTSLTPTNSEGLLGRYLGGGGNTARLSSVLLTDIEYSSLDKTEAGGSGMGARVSMEGTDQRQ